MDLPSLYSHQGGLQGYLLEIKGRNSQIHQRFGVESFPPWRIDYKQLFLASTLIEGQVRLLRVVFSTPIRSLHYLHDIKDNYQALLPRQVFVSPLVEADLSLSCQLYVSHIWDDKKNSQNAPSRLGVLPLLIQCPQGYQRDSQSPVLHRQHSHNQVALKAAKSV